MAMKPLLQGSCLFFTVLVLMNVREASGSMSIMIKSALAMMGAEKCEPIMDIVAEKAKNIKGNIVRYCDNRCKKSGEFHGSDLTKPELKAYIERMLKFVLGRLAYECWGFDDLMGTTCKDKARKEIFTLNAKYKNRKGAVEECQKKISIKVILGIFDQVWKECIMGPDGKDFREIKEMCKVDTKKDPAKKAFDNLGKCIQGIAMPLVMEMTPCGQWAGAFCVEGKPKIEKVCDDYMIKWFKNPCMDWQDKKPELQVNGGTLLETYSAKICPKGYASDSGKKKIDCPKNSPSYK